MAVTVNPGITRSPKNGGSNGGRRATNQIVIHTQEGNGTAVGLAEFCANNGVSYNLIVDAVDTILLVDEDEGPWAAMEANNVAVHICGAGTFANWSRGDWLGRDAMLWRMARVASWLSQTYGIPLVRVGATTYAPGNWPNARGVCGHVSYGSRGGGHYDPGTGFPWDDLLKRAQSLITPAVPLNLIDQAAGLAKDWIGKRLTEAGVKGEKILRDKAGNEIGRYVPYENAHVYWRTGEKFAYVVPHGGLFEAWGELGWESGPLGFPVRQFAKLPDGAVQAFQNGVLYRKDGQPAFYVGGIIGKRYLAEGAELSDLGYPTSLEYANGTGGRAQDFEHGTLEWDPTGAVKDLDDVLVKKG